MTSYVVGEEDLGKRLDGSVAAHLALLSRASVQKLSEQGLITVNSKVKKSSYKLRAGDRIVVDYDEKRLKRIPIIDLPIIYEDHDCVVIDKPSGLLTHSKGAFNPEATVATWLEQKYGLKKAKDIMPSTRVGIVHRLDRATSGVMICAKTPEAVVFLQQQFSQRKTRKTYSAIINGQLKPDRAIIDMPIERNPKLPQTFRVSSKGKPAITEYETTKTTGKYSLVTLKPLTGRTHQLRVHLKQIKHPIVGDTLYGGEAADRLYLHALNLEITLPGHKRRKFTAKLPKVFNEFMVKS